MPGDLTALQGKALLLDRIAEHPARQLDELLQWNWRLERKPALSDHRAMSEL